MKLIDKDALVAEIKRLLAFYLKEIENNKEDPWAMDIAKRDILQEILSFLDTLEMKEAVDAEIVEVEDNNNSMYAYTHLEICTDEDLSKICKAGDKAKVIIIKQK